MSSNDKTYNGWRNYETWNVKLWMDNDQSGYLYWNERTIEAFQDAEADQTFSRLENATFRLADELKAWHGENMPEVSGTYADLLGAALSEVDWHEIATSLLEDAEVE